MKKMLFLVVLAITILSCDFVRLPPKEETIHRYLNDLSFIPAPRSGGRPMTFFEHWEFKGNVVWTNAEGHFVFGQFVEGGTYTAEISILPKEGFNFDNFDTTFVHRESKGITQTVSQNRAFVVIEFPRILFDQMGEFLSLTGERLKAFYLEPDPLFTIPFSFSGEVSHQWQERIGTDEFGNGVYQPRTSSATNTIATTIQALALLRPSEHQAILNGTIQTRANNQNQFTANDFSGHITELSNILPSDLVNTREHNISEVFNNPSNVLPVTGYIANIDFVEFTSFHIPALTIPVNVVQQIHNPTNARHNILNRSSSNHANIPLRQVSRDFYIYRTISVQYEPHFVISAWATSFLNLVESFDFDPETNTLTANLIMYNERKTGEIFSYNITTETGVTQRNSISIGN